MIQIVTADGVQEKALIADLRSRSAAVGEEITRSAAAIMEDVRRRGYEAVEEYSLKFDKAAPREFAKEELDAAYAACDARLIRAMEHAAANIRDYNEHLLAKTVEWTSPDGGRVGRVVRGLTRVGIYVPGGTAAYPSSVLMNAVPAKVAGVEEIIMVTPPTANLNNAVLAAAKIAGVDRVIGLGGVQAVAALTYGAGFIPKVDKLVGPGNAFVAAAKRMAYGTLDIDMVAGPSEVLVIADETAEAKYVAADLLSQAEHDRLASAILLTTSMELARQVDSEIVRQTGYLSRSEIMEESLKNFGAVIVCPSLERCVELANRGGSRASGGMHRRSPCASASDQECRCGVPGSLGARAAGRLSGRPGSCSAHLWHGSLLFAAERGQLPQDHECAGIRPCIAGAHSR